MKLNYAMKCFHVLCKGCLNSFVWSGPTHFFCPKECGTYCPLCTPTSLTRAPCSTWPTDTFRRNKDSNKDLSLIAMEDYMQRQLLKEEKRLTKVANKAKDRENKAKSWARKQAEAEVNAINK